MRVPPGSKIQKSWKLEGFCPPHNKTPELLNLLFKHIFYKNNSTNAKNTHKVFFPISRHWTQLEPIGVLANQTAPQLQDPSLACPWIAHAPPRMRKADIGARRPMPTPCQPHANLMPNPTPCGPMRARPKK